MWVWEGQQEEGKTEEMEKATEEATKEKTKPEFTYTFLVEVVDLKCVFIKQIK